ncbi:MAG TPA: formate/nitrite transporter family protein [Alphaproteobacteria bacterium]|nr:formate/nitrite transporter family protein [Alphaproteobacteria bacterium]
MPKDLPDPHRGLDALLPAEVAERAEQIGAAKTRLDWMTLTTLAVLGGAFIGLGGMFATTVLAGVDGPSGPVRMLAGLAFALGLVLVVVGGAELFTGNNLMVMAWASGKVRLREMLRAWAIVWAGNFIGAIGTAGLVFLSGQPLLDDGSALTALKIAAVKTNLPLLRAFFLGIVCNVLVCLAVWLSYAGRGAADKILAILLPVSAFVTAGFEHSVANMYFVPLGFMLAWFGPELLVAAGSGGEAAAALSLYGFVRNLVAVTIGNVIGGGLLVGAVYWFIYLRRR